MDLSTAKGFCFLRETRYSGASEYAFALNQTIVLKFGHQTQETAPAWWAEAAGQLVDLARGPEALWRPLR
jgi:hypothetical protein